MPKLSETAQGLREAAAKRANAGHKIRPAIANDGKAFYVYDEKHLKLFAVGLDYKHAKYVAKKAANAGNHHAAMHQMPADGTALEQQLVDAFLAAGVSDGLGIVLGGVSFIRGAANPPVPAAASSVPVAPGVVSGEIHSVPDRDLARMQLPVTGGVMGENSFGMAFDQADIDDAVDEANASGVGTTPAPIADPPPAITSEASDDLDAVIAAAGIAVTDDAGDDAEIIVASAPAPIDPRPSRKERKAAERATKAAGKDA